LGGKKTPLFCDFSPSGGGFSLFLVRNPYLIWYLKVGKPPKPPQKPDFPTFSDILTLPKTPIFGQNSVFKSEKIKKSLKKK
jgi:hypothetical protein